MRALHLQEELKKWIGLNFMCVHGFPNDQVSVSEEVAALPLSRSNRLPSLRLPAEAGLT